MRRRSIKGTFKHKCTKTDALEICHDNGYSPAESLIRIRADVEELIKEKEREIEIGAPGLRGSEGGDGRQEMLQKLREYAARLDERLMPYCYARKQKAEVTGEDGGPLQVNIVKHGDD